MKNTLCLLLILLFVAACTTNSSPDSQNEKPAGLVDSSMAKIPKKEPQPLKNTAPAFEKTVLCQKIKFNVREVLDGESAMIHVSNDDLSIRKYDHEFPVQGRIQSAFGTDQNDDGFCELYLIIQSNEDDEKLEIIGVASYNDKSAGEINVNDVNLARRKGSDKVYVHYDKLKREFYDENGVLHVYNYNLIKGEAGFILEPVRYK